MPNDIIMRDVEFLIVQYLDGSLAEGERAALEARLANDPEARALLDEHRALDVLLRRDRIPDIRWDVLSRHLSSAVMAAQMPEVEEPVHTLRMPWVGWAGKLAIAATLVIATGIVIVALKHGSPKTTSPMASTTIKTNVQVATGFVSVTGPKAEGESGPAESQVSVGPSRAIAGESMLAQYNDEVISRPAHIMVASGANPVQDTDAQTFDMQ
jgi:anti-sigma factor RsiW